MSEDTISPPVCLSACYVPGDATAWSDLKRHLSSLRDEGMGITWHDRVISTDNTWAFETDPFFESSQIILLLVSPALLESSYCEGREIHRALRSHEEKETRVMPILLESVDLGGTSIEKLEVLPSTSRPINQWPSRDDAWGDVAKRVREVATEFSNPTLIATDVDQTTSLHRRGEQLAAIESEEIPPAIGRYSIKGVLGEGNYGRVYLAYDAELDRDVAIKAPHLYRVAKPEDVEAYLTEARLVAKLDHPALVPVYDVGYTLDGRCYVVSKLIEGKDLRKLLKDGALSFIESARLIAEVADALDYAHKRDLVHRDIKPANILIDRDGNPYVADFGMAIREEDYGKGAKYAGTPAYMSPEQARGEGHRVDGRSDVFSLGVVLYELITGRRAFRSHKLNQLFHEISNSEVRPPRQMDPGIPRELERICLKAMANRLTDRYTTAGDLAEDLKFFVDDQIHDEAAHSFPAASESGESTRRSGGLHGSSRRTGHVSSRRSHRRSGRGSGAAERLTDRGSSTFNPDLTASGEATIKIIPKGLRSFDDQDSSFFLRLLPGTRDRYGVPDTLRFWKNRIELDQPDQVFTVGLIYGPSGCGKSSFVRAGLLPLLDESVVCLFVEASASDTEGRLLRGLRSKCSRLPPDLDLVDAMTAIRRGEGLRPGNKLLIVLDQFEQWLHGQHDVDAHAMLLDALRQCDGVTVQCLLLVRVDYMMGIHRCMQELEVRIQEGHNSAAVDLFDKAHARNVLIEFGCAYGRLPENPEEFTEDQEAFLEQAIDELADDEKVVQVHLSVFADMLKGRRWERQTLRTLGGAKGIGVKFLDETFESVSAPMPNRLHQKAARAVLKSLMPPPGTNIKGGKRSYDELKAISSYEQRPDDFTTLIGILDRDLRLITPTDPEVDPDEDPLNVQSDVGRYYELTHDYLVPALREWLTRKQRETRRGRAELRLEERAAIWHDKPQRRHLPSLWEYLNIRWLTHRSDWTDAQQQMMRHASRYHGARFGFAAAALLLVILIGSFIGNKVVAKREEVLVNGLVTALETAEIGELNGLLEANIAPHRKLVEPKLRERLNDPNTDGLAEVNFRIAMLDAEDGQQQVEPLFEYYMKNAKPDEVAALREFLADKALVKLDQLWDVLTHPTQHSVDERFRAASGLAVYDKDGQRWSPAILNDLSRQLVLVPRSVVGQWADNLRPVGDRLREPIRAIYLDTGRSERERTTAADLLGRYGHDEPSNWVTLVTYAANHEQLNVFVDKLKPHGNEAIKRLQQELAELLATSNKLESEYQDGLTSADDLATERDGVQSQWKEVDAKLTAAKAQDGSQAEQDELQQSLEELNQTLSRLDRQLSTVRQTLRRSNQTLEQLASQAANVAIALLHFNQTDEVWPLLASRPDPRRRTYLIHRMADMAVDPNQVVDLVVNELRRRSLPSDENVGSDEEVSISIALILSLGGFREDARAARQAELSTLLLKWFRESSDPGIHSATKWLLQKQGLASKVDEVESELRGRTQKDKRWYIDKSGNTMIVFPAGDKLFLMGSPISEIGRERGLSTVNDNTYEKRHLRRIEWPFAISATEVTVEQFLKFRSDFRYAVDISPEPDSPINYPQWYDAARYCNWLSAQEGIPKDQHCYIFESRRSILSKDPIPTIHFPADFVSRSGYRLPTEAEWEYVCRAGTTTSWCFGESDVLLRNYAWYAGNSGEQMTHTVAGFMPNDWGLFDMYGNVAEWCHDVFVGFEMRNAQEARPDSRVIELDRLLVTDQQIRSLRGGGYNSPAARTRSAARDATFPDNSFYGYGFRVVRSGQGLNPSD